MADWSCLCQSDWERKEGSGSHIAPQPATAVPQPCPSPVSPARAYEKDQLRPGGPQRGVGHAPPCLQMVRQKCTLERGRNLVVCSQTLRDGSVSGGKKIAGSSGGKYRKCNSKSDSKRRGHHPGQKGMRGPPNDLQSVFELAHRTTRPGSKGVCSLPRDVASEMTAPETAESHPIQHWGRRPVQPQSS